jgi:hypothetical protein
MVLLALESNQQDNLLNPLQWAFLTKYFLRPNGGSPCQLRPCLQKGVVTDIHFPPASLLSCVEHADLAILLIELSLEQNTVNISTCNFLDNIQKVHST